MKNTYRAVFMTVLLTFTTQMFCFADTGSDTTPAPYAPDEFPVFMKDIRRFEIISLGAMPFITLNASLAYSIGKYAAHDFDSDYSPNPFAKSSDGGYSEDEQKGILLTSLGISVGIGLTDFIVNIIKHSKKNKKIHNENSPVQIVPLVEDKNAVKIEPPQEQEILNDVISDDIKSEKNSISPASPDSAKNTEGEN